MDQINPDLVMAAVYEKPIGWDDASAHLGPIDRGVRATIPADFDERGNPRGQVWHWKYHKQIGWKSAQAARPKHWTPTAEAALSRVEVIKSDPSYVSLMHTGMIQSGIPESEARQLCVPEEGSITNLADHKRYTPHFTDVIDPHPKPQRQQCGHPRPSLRITASDPEPGGRLIGLSCEHVAVGPLFDAETDPHHFDLDPTVELEGAEAVLFEKLIDDHSYYLPDDACDFADDDFYEAHFQGPAHTIKPMTSPEFRES